MSPASPPVHVCRQPHLLAEAAVRLPHLARLGLWLRCLGVVIGGLGPSDEAAVWPATRRLKKLHLELVLAQAWGGGGQLEAVGRLLPIDEDI